MSKSDISRIYLIIEKIEYIEEIVKKEGNITNALADFITTRPAILMHLTAIAEQFNKIKKNNNQEVLSFFDLEDLKGLCDTRTYIAHDYDGVNLAIIDWIVRKGLPKLKKQCKDVLKKFNQL